MEGYPVLLEQVGHCLRRTLSYSLSQYLQEVPEDDLIWQSSDGQRYPKRLGKVFEATLARLANCNSDALAFIQFCAYLNPDCISTRILDFWIKDKGLTPKDRREILGCLHDFQLLRYHPTSQTFSCHRLVQLVVQHQDKEGKIYLSSFDTLVKWAKTFDWDEIETWDIGEECVCHLEKMRKSSLWETKEQKGKSDLLYAAGCWFTQVKKDYTKGLVLFEEGLEVAKAIYGEESLELTFVESAIGVCHREKGDKNKASLYFDKSLKIRKAKLGEVHRETAISYINLASIVPEDSNQALEYYQKALQIFEAIHQGKPHPDIAIGHYKIASCHWAAGRDSSAIDSIKKAVKISEDYFQKPHPATADSYLLLGNILDDPLSDLRTEEALKATRKAVEIYEAVYGKTHVKVADGYRELGNRHRRLKQYELAMQKYDESMKIYRDLYGESSEGIANLLIEKGCLLSKQEAFNEALESCQKGLKTLQSIRPDDQNQLASALFQIALILKSLARYQESLTHFQDVWKMMHPVYGDNNVTIFVLYNIAENLEHLSRHREALHNFVMVFQAAVRTDNPYVNQYFQRVCQSFAKQTDFEYASQIKVELLAFCIEYCGEDSDYVLQLRQLGAKSASARSDNGCSVM